MGAQMKNTDNTFDPAVEARLEKCKKLLARDPVVRQEAWINLLKSLLSLALIFAFLIYIEHFFDSIDKYQSPQFSFLSTLQVYLGISTKIGFQLLILMMLLPSAFGIATSQKICKYIALEYHKFANSTSEDMKTLFSKQELRHINYTTKNRIIYLVGSFICVAGSAVVIIMLSCLCRTFFNFMPEQFYELPAKIMSTLRILSIIIGIGIGFAIPLAVFSFFENLSDLFFYKRTTIHEQLLLKLRELNN